MGQRIGKRESVQQLEFINLNIFCFFIFCRSVVTASVLYDSNSVVDIAKIQQRLLNKNTTMGIITQDEDVTLVSVRRRVVMLKNVVIINVLISGCP